MAVVLLQIDHFIQAIEMNPAVVSLKGYANVNRELLTSVSIICYLFILQLADARGLNFAFSQIPLVFRDKKYPMG